MRARLVRALDAFEETLLALLLAAMVLVSFSQVVARYVFNSGWVSALELTRILFAWLILIGMSYGIRIGAHLGVDAVVRLLPRPLFRAASVFAALACAFYALLLLDSSWFTALLGARDRGGAIDYISKMRDLGIELEDLKLERWIAYIILPIALALFAVRSLLAAWDIARGRRVAVIAAHEEEALKVVPEAEVVAEAQADKVAPPPRA